MLEFHQLQHFPFVVKMATWTTIKVFATFFVLFWALPMNLSSRVLLHKEPMDNQQLLRKLGFDFSNVKAISRKNGVERFLREAPSGPDPHHHDSKPAPPRPSLLM